MILYNVTVNIDHSVEEEWLKWMKEQHIPDVMNTGCFKRNLLCKINAESKGGSSYSIQYFCDSQKELDHYLNNYAAQLQQEHAHEVEQLKAQIKKLHHDHGHEVEQLKAQIEQLQLEHGHEVEQLKAQIKKLHHEVEQLEQNHTTAIDQMQRELKEQIKTLTTEHNLAVAKFQAEVQQQKLKNEEMQAQLTAAQAEVRVGVDSLRLQCRSVKLSLSLTYCVCW